MHPLRHILKPHNGTTPVHPALIISLALTFISGIVLFGSGEARHGLALEITFGISVATFLGLLLIVLAQKAERSLDGDDRPPTNDSDTRRSDGTSQR